MHPVRLLPAMAVVALAMHAASVRAQQALSNLGQGPTGQAHFFDSLDVDIYNPRPGTSGEVDCWPSLAPSQAPLNAYPVSACSSVQYGHTTTDFDRNDDARDFTSEALYSQSTFRLDRPLTRDEMRSIARIKDEFESTNHVTFAFEGLPTVDLFYRYRSIGNAQITNFYVPSQTNTVDVQEYGIYTEKSISLSSDASSSITVGLGYSHGRQVGLVEFVPNDVENVDQYSARLGLQGNVGSGKLVLNGDYDYQNIQLVNPDLYQSKRSIYGVRLFYFDQTAVETGTGRGVEYVLGAAHDIQWYGAVTTPRNDYFGGVILYGQRPFGSFVPVDFWILPAVLTSTASNGGSQANAQDRTNLAAVFHLPVRPGILGSSPTVSVEFRHDVAIEGPDYFENVRLGVHFGTFIPPIWQGGPICHFEIGYDTQSFYRIGKNFQLAGAHLSVGF